MAHTVSDGLALDVQGVSKTYGGGLGSGRRVQALRGVDMQVHAGSIFGLLGPNGAGKSTLVKILTTVIRPTTCSGRVLGVPVGNKESLRRLGYLPEHHKFPEYLTAGQVLDYYAALSDVPSRTRKARTKELLDLVGIGAWEHKKVKGFSKGMRQRLGIANAIMHDPDLVILDEPTDGVDPVGRREIREVLIALKERGKTIFLNSHLLSELEMVCDRVAIMVQGRVWAQGTIDELTKDSQRYEIEVAPTSASGVAQLGAGGQGSGEHARGLTTALRSVVELASDPDVVRTGELAPPAGVMRGTLMTSSGRGPLVVVEDRTLKVMTDDAEVVQPMLDALRAAGLVVKAVRPVRESLEDLFMKAVTDPVTGKTLAPGAAGFGAPRERGPGGGGAAGTSSAGGRA